MAIEQVEPTIRAGEWLTIFAALIGPILAVQAQKIVEWGRAKNAVKNQIFQTLMATRASRLSTEHVKALNMIDIAFYGIRIFRQRWQSKGEKEVCRCWRDYFDNLGTDINSLTDSQRERIFDQGNDKFIALLEAIAVEQHYDFDKVELRKSMYNPVAHNQIEDENRAIRSGLAEVLQSKRSIAMYVTNLSDINVENNSAAK